MTGLGIILGAYILASAYMKVHGYIDVGKWTIKWEKQQTGN